MSDFDVNIAIKFMLNDQLCGIKFYKAYNVHTSSPESSEGGGVPSSKSSSSSVPPFFARLGVLP